MNRGVTWTANAVAGLLMGGMSLTSHAASLNFYCITNADISGASCASGAAQLSVDITDAGNGGVLFWLTNSGSAASSITDVYFDDNESNRYLSAMTGFIDADEGTGGHALVDFSIGASPKELPGAKNTGFVTTLGLSADSDAPTQKYGVNLGEWLGINFSLPGNRTYTDVLSGLANGGLRIGLHVQAFAGGYSESFVNNPYTNNVVVPEPASVVPVPAAVWLLGSGLLGLVVTGRRKSV